MNAKETFLKVYGLLHFILGLGQIVGLTAGYFLNEFVIQTPSEAVQNILDENLMALVFLAIILRSIYHVGIGIGIARLRLWARPVIIIGWIGLLVVTFGLVFAFYDQWAKDGYTQDILAIIAWPKLFVLFLTLGFEIIFVRAWILEANRNSARDIGLNLKSIWLTFAGTILVLVLILFLGNPIKQGFHQGFYKSRGEKEAKTKKVLETTFEKKSVEDTEILKESDMQPQLPETQVLIQKKEVVPLPQPESIAPQTPEPAEALQNFPKIEETKANQGLPYQTLFGFLGGFLLLIGLLIQAYGFYIEGSFVRMKSFSYIFFFCGFTLWTIYGMIGNLMPLESTGLLLALLSLALVFSNKRN